MLKFIHVADAHLTGTEELLYGISPRKRLSSCFAHIKANHPDAVFIAITGDVAEKGEEGAIGFCKKKPSILVCRCWLRPAIMTA